MHATEWTDETPLMDELLRRLALAVEGTELTVTKTREHSIISGELVPRASYADARGAAPGARRESDVGPCLYFVNAVRIVNGRTTNVGAVRVRLAEVSSCTLGRVPAGRFTEDAAAAALRGDLWRR